MVVTRSRSQLITLLYLRGVRLVRSYGWNSPDQMPCLRPARRGEPKRLRLRFFAVAGHLVHGGRRLRLRLTTHWPWLGSQITAAVTRL